MTKFRLEKISSNNSVTKFDVRDSSGICGRICTSPRDEAALLAHWKNGPRPTASAATAGKRNPMIAAMLAAKKHPMTRASILRGC
jgi:hypothetical protein